MRKLGELILKKTNKKQCPYDKSKPKCAQKLLYIMEI